MVGQARAIHQEGNGRRGCSASRARTDAASGWLAAARCCDVDPRRKRIWHPGFRNPAVGACRRCRAAVVVAEGPPGPSTEEIIGWRAPTSSSGQQLGAALLDAVQPQLLGAQTHARGY
eukprot:COSAG03_NODE_9390_length_723_cov_1.501603_1_plen_117_part_01